LANGVGALDKFMDRACPVLNDDDDPSVELPLGVINIG
jgi:hypothetical protein